MAAPKCSEESKAFFVLAKEIISQLVSYGVTAGATTVTDTLTAIDLEIAAR